MNRARHLRYQYGISDEHYEWLLKKQRSTCAICGSSNSRCRWGKFFIDHDHQTKQVRGLLCMDCNTGLGKFKDNTQLLLKAALYVKEKGFANELERAQIELPPRPKRRYDPETHAKKLSAAQVFEIHKRLASVVTQTKIARDFGVSQAMISRIALGKAWSKA